MTEAYGFDLETYLERTGRLRRLARSMTPDSAAADDAVQETWQQALRSRPDEGLGWSAGWLEVVLRNTMHRQRRSVARRRRREVEAARSESIPGADDIAMRSELVRRLSAAIDELEPALRECTVLRYFEDLAPRTIAQQLELPRREVYRRLEAARDALRSRLAEQGYSPRSKRLGWGGLLAWRSALGSKCSGEARFGPWLAATGAGLVMAKVVWSLVVTAMVVAVFWFVSSEREEPPVDAPTQAVAAVPESARAEPEAAVAEREAVGAKAAVGASMPTARVYPFAVDVHVVDSDDQPADYALIWAAPEGHPLNAIAADADGVVRLRFDGRSPAMDFVVGGGSSSRSGLLRRIALRSGTTAQLGVQSVRRRGAKSERVMEEAAEAAVAAASEQATTRPPWAHRDAEGRVTFVVAAQGMAYLDPGIEFDELTEAELELEDATNYGRIRGMVTDAQGRPASNVLVTVRDAVPSPAGPDEPEPSFSERRRRGGVRNATRTDADGRYEVLAPAGAYRLHAGGGDFGRAVNDVEIDPDGLEWNPRLDRGAEFRGVLRRSDGQPASKWWVRIEASNGPTAYVDRIRTAADGSFAIPNVPVAQCRVLVRRLYSALPIQVATAAPVGPIYEFSVPVAALAKQVTARGRLAGAEAVAIEARLWDSTTGFGLRETGSEGDVRFEGVPQGLHHLQVVGPALRYEPSLPVSISERSPAQVELGEIRVHPAAILAFWLPGEKRPVLPTSDSVALAADGGVEVSGNMDVVELMWRHRHVVSRARLDGILGVRMVAVPPGEWTVRVGGSHGVIQAGVPGVEYPLELTPDVGSTSPK